LQRERSVHLWHDHNKRFLGEEGGALKEFVYPLEETIFVLSQRPGFITLKTKTSGLYVGEDFPPL